MKKILLPIVFVVGMAGSRARAEIAWGLADTNVLLQFDVSTPSQILGVKRVSGLQTGERIVGVDFRPRDGKLYGVGITDNGPSGDGRLYRIDLRTGAATPIGGAPFSSTLDPSAGYAIDFNPVTDQLRVITNQDVNLRVNATTGVLIATDTPVDVVGQGEEIAGCAYDHSTESATSTSLFAVDIATAKLVTFATPNNGAGTAIGALGVTPESSYLGFDISPDSGTAFATMRVGELSRLYTVNLQSGAATQVGLIGNGAQSVGGIAIVPRGVVVTGAGKSKHGGPAVKLFDPGTGAELDSFFAFETNFRGGVRVATGDVNGDGVLDIVAGAGPGGGPHVKVFDGTNLAVLHDFLAFDDPFKGGVFVAAADVNGDGDADVVVAPDKGAGAGAHVKVFSGANGAELASLFAFDPNFTGGVSVAAGDVNGDGFADVIAGQLSGKRADVAVFSGPSLTFVGAFQPFENSYQGGVRVALGDVTGDGVPEAISIGSKRVLVRDGVTLLPVFGGAGGFAPGVKGFPSVACADLDGDGVSELIVASGAGKHPRLRVFDAAAGGEELGAFDNLEPFSGFKGGVFVAGANGP